MVIDKHGNPIGFRNRKIINIVGDGAYHEVVVPDGMQDGTIFITAHGGDDDAYTINAAPIEFHMKDTAADTAFMALSPTIISRNKNYIQKQKKIF